MVDEQRTHGVFIAKFSSLCDYCGSQIMAGDAAVRLHDHSYICMACYGSSRAKPTA